MRKVILCLAIAAVMSPSAFAGAPELAKSKECLSCHSVERDTLAPSFTKIAAKYRNQSGAENHLIETVMKGTPTVGGYHWGTMKMPSPGARTVVSREEAQQLVGWILSLK
ncbi:c-type cytochrome [Pseudomonas citronellolis]|uniref:c-type cytochrome n=1 Tax=Pseudomonas citronellolis TaxID=53408 RepID=UPI0021BE4F42|nr:c-type cytochrome [Pseudomonas citronellolis]UXJ50235.1 c-type cytochrome [Pseudomonas citronellolis]